MKITMDNTYVIKYSPDLPNMWKVVVKLPNLSLQSTQLASLSLAEDLRTVICSDDPYKKSKELEIHNR